MGKHLTPIARPGKPGLVVPADDAIPARSYKGLVPSTGISGRASLVSPQNDEARGEGATPKGTLKVSKPKNTGRVHAKGPSEHVLP